MFIPRVGIQIARQGVVELALLGLDLAQLFHLGCQRG